MMLLAWSDLGIGIGIRFQVPEENYPNAQVLGEIMRTGSQICSVMGSWVRRNLST